MIKSVLTNRILNSIVEIEKNRDALEKTDIPASLSVKLRKNTKKRSSYASNKIEGNPLSFEQASVIIDSKNRHFLRPEQEIRNYYLALQFLEEKLKKKEPISADLILQVQEMIVKGESEEKKGFRGAMPPGFLFAVYDSQTGKAEYIPPEWTEVPGLVEELVRYITESDDHPLIKAAILHYQLVTIHPFEDGNGRTARIMSDYLLKLNGYGFKDIGSLEEYFAYDLDEYYSSLQMGLPAMYYEGRNNPPHPEIWIEFFLKVFSLYSGRVLKTADSAVSDDESVRYTHLSKKAKAFLEYLKKNKITVFTPTEIATSMSVSNRTIINWSTELCANGFLSPGIVNKRIRSYKLI
jgi:Fic family protein